MRLLSGRPPGSHFGAIWPRFWVDFCRFLELFWLLFGAAGSMFCSPLLRGAGAFFLMLGVLLLMLRSLFAEVSPQDAGNGSDDLLLFLGIP